MQSRTSSELKYQMKAVLEKAEVSPKHKQALAEAFALLQEQEEAQLQICRQNIEQAQTGTEAEWTKQWQIMTMLIPQKDEAYWHEQHFYPVLPEHNSIYQPQWNELTESFSSEQDNRPHLEFYWQGSYEEMQAFLRQNRRLAGSFQREDGLKQKFSFSLQLSEQAVAKEKLLYELANLYGIMRPVIFSPWARRLLSIRLEEPKWTIKEFFAEGNNQARYDFCWQENSLAGKIIEGQELVWNVRTLPDEDFNGLLAVQSEPASWGQQEHYLLEYLASVGDEADFCQNLYLTLPAALSTHTMDVQVQMKTQSKLQLRVHTDLPLQTPCQTRGICIEPVPAEVRATVKQMASDFVERIFVNNYELLKNREVSRLLTKGLVMRQLARYETARFACGEPELHKSDATEILYGYQQPELAYGAGTMRKENEYYHRLRQKQLPICYIPFYAKEERWQNYLLDYAQYVLTDLKRRYPDYRWLGVRA